MINLGLSVEMKNGTTKMSFLGLKKNREIREENSAAKKRIDEIWSCSRNKLNHTMILKALPKCATSNQKRKMERERKKIYSENMVSLMSKFEILLIRSQTKRQNPPS